MINWMATKKEDALLIEIAKKAVKMYNLDYQKLVMDLTATHCNGNKLKLKNFLNSDNLNFGHDIFGIINNIDRNSGKLLNCFLPRFSE